jgi:hypothetical protein
MSPVDLRMVKKTAEAAEDFTLSVYKVLKGFYARVGGEEKFGDKMGIMFDDATNSPAATRAALGSAMLKLTLQMTEPDDPDPEGPEGLLTDDQMKAELARLDAIKK